MSISPLAKVLIILNNYFHDVATAMLLSSAIILWLLGRYAVEGGDESLAAKWFPGAYRILTKVALFSIIWIVVGGIPRTVFFQQVEWNLSDASNKYLFSALMVKHAFMWIAVAAGVYLWTKMRRLVGRLTEGR